MIQDYDPNTYWDERCRLYGHTGWLDELIYSYDQPLRLRAIAKVLFRSGILINENSKILDVGCGTGDLVYKFAKKGATVVGTDISSEVIEKAKEKFSKENINVDLFTAKIEDLKFPPNSFDLVTSVTVLQHINDKKILQVVKKIVDVTQIGGNMLILESSPYKKTNIDANYIFIRTREEWVRLFKDENCALIDEVGFPQIGIKILERYDYIFRRFLSGGKNIKRNVVKSAVCRLFNLGRKMILKLSYPLDYFIWPFPKKYSDVRILIFRKNGQ